MQKSIAIVCAKNPDCPDTLRALGFFTRQGGNVEFDIVKYNSGRAMELWGAAAEKVGDKKGHPLVCVFTQGIGTNDKPVVEWAAVEPTTQELWDSLTQAGFELKTIEDMPDEESACCV